MRILLLSDIHGNYPALCAVDKESQRLSPDCVIHCGDSLVYAPFPNETLDWLRRRHALSIRGNTDDGIIRLLRGKRLHHPKNYDKRVMYATTAEALRSESKNFLFGLETKAFLTVEGFRIGVFHGSPADHEEFLFSHSPDTRFHELAAATDCQVVLTGHSHTPYHKYIGGVRFINPGSVGRMFDGCPDAAYAILEISGHSLELRHYRCPYALDWLMHELGQQQLPPIYAQMFRQGLKLN